MHGLIEQEQVVVEEVDVPREEESKEKPHWHEAEVEAVV